MTSIVVQQKTTTIVPRIEGAAPIKVVTQPGTTVKLAPPPAMTIVAAARQGPPGPRGPAGEGSADAPVLAPASSQRNVIQPTQPGYVPLVLKGAVGQTAPLQQWQDAMGNVDAQMLPGGGVILGALPTGSVAESLITAGQLSGGGMISPNVAGDSVAYVAQATFGIVDFLSGGGVAVENDSIYMDGGAGGQLVLEASSSRSGQTITAAPGQSDYLQQWRGTGGQLATISADGGLAVQGGPGQTADLQQWKRSDGKIAAYLNVSDDGYNELSLIGLSPQAPTSYVGNNYVGVYANRTSYLPYAEIGYNEAGGANLSVALGYNETSPGIRGTSAPSKTRFSIWASPGQIDDLQQWKGSNGAVLARVDPSGRIFAAGVTVDGTGAPSLEFKNSGGTVDTSFARTSAGTMTVEGKNGTSTTLVAKAAPSQTQSLQEWQGSDGSVKAKVMADGTIMADQGVHRFGFTQFKHPAFRPTLTAGSTVLAQQIIPGNAGLKVTGYPGSSVGIAEFYNDKQTDGFDQPVPPAPTLVASISQDGAITTNSGAGYVGRGDGYMGLWLQGNRTLNNYSLLQENFGQLDINAPNSLSFRANNQPLMTMSATELATNRPVRMNNSGMASAHLYTPLSIEAASSQAVDLQRWLDQGGNVQGRVYNDASAIKFGKLALGKAETVSQDSDKDIGLISWPSQTGGSGRDAFVIQAGSLYGLPVIVPNAYDTALKVRAHGQYPGTNVQEWQNSAGAPLASVKSNGSAVFGTNETISGGPKLNLVGYKPGSGQPNDVNLEIGDGAGTVYWRMLRTESNNFEQRLSGNLTTVNENPIVVPSAVRAAPGQVADIAYWTDSNGAALVSVGPTGALRASGEIDQYATNSGVYIGKQAGSPRAVFANGNSSQNWQIDNAGGDFRWFLPGQLKMTLTQSTGLSVPDGISSPLANFTGNVDRTIMTVKGAVGQTQDLHQWKDANNNTIAKVDASGNIYGKFGSFTDPGTFTALALRGGVYHISGAGADGYERYRLGNDGALQIGGGSAGPDPFDVGFNRVSPGVLAINGSGYGTSQPFTLQVSGTAAQGVTAIQEWRNSNNTLLASMSPTGALNATSLKTTQDITVTDATKGIVLTSPNGTKYRITSTDAGTAQFTAI